VKESFVFKLSFNVKVLFGYRTKPDIHFNLKTYTF